MNYKFQWFKSSYSGNGASCVECAYLPDGGMAVRDTKNRGGPMLGFTTAQWQAFVASVRHGKFSNFS